MREHIPRNVDVKPILFVLLYVALLLPFYTLPFRVDVLDGETAAHLPYALASIMHPAIWNWFGTPYIRPVTFNIVTLVQYELFGLNAHGWQLVVFFSYLTNAILILYFFRRLFDSPNPAFIGGLFWSLSFPQDHTLFVKSGGNYVHIMALLASLNLLQNYRTSGARRYIWLAAACFAIALLSNEIAVIFIGLYFLFFYSLTHSDLPARRRALRALHDSAPFLVCLLPYLALVLLFREKFAMRDPTHSLNFDLRIIGEAISLYAHWLIQVPSSSWQDIFYRNAALGFFTQFMYILSALGVIGAAYAFLHSGARPIGGLSRNLLLFVILGMLVTLVPFIFAKYPPQYYVLLSQIFYAFVLAAGLWALVLRPLEHRNPALAFSVALLMGIVLSAHAYAQANAFYRNPAAPTGHLLLNDMSVHDDMVRRFPNEEFELRYVILNLEEVHFSYHFQNGKFFRMYNKFKPVEIINFPEIKSKEALASKAASLLATQTIDRDKVMVLYFEKGIFVADVTDEVWSHVMPKATH